MVFSVEAYAGEVGGREGVKLEEQVIVTADGPENLSKAPYDERLLGSQSSGALEASRDGTKT